MSNQTDSAANQGKLIIYSGPWGHFNIRNYLAEADITDADGTEGEWFFTDESINLYEFLTIVDRAIVANPNLHVSVTTKQISDSDKWPKWTQRLLERRATPTQLQHVRIL